MGYCEDLKVCKFRVRQTPKETKVYKYNMAKSVSQGFDVYEKFYTLPRNVETRITLAMALRSMKNNTTFIGIYGERGGLKSIYENRGVTNDVKTLQAECNP
jgi:hypothetical protein